MKKIFNSFFAKVALISVYTVFLTINVWADPVTLVSGSGTSNYAVPDGWTTSGTVEGGSYLKIDNGTITSPTFAAHTGLSFAYSVATFGSGTNHPLTIRILNASTDAVITEKTTATPTSSSYINTNSPLSLGDVNVPFKIQLYAPTGKGIRLRNYSITGTPAGDTQLTDSDLAITGAPVALSFDLYNNSNAKTVSYTTSSTGAVTVSGGVGYITTSINTGTKTITVTPTAVTPSPQTITIDQIADANYASGSVTFTVSIADSTPFTGGDVTFTSGTDLGSTTTNADGDEVSKEVVTISSTKAAFATSEYRLYQNSVTTISTSSGTITDIAFTKTGSYDLANLSTETGSYDSSNGTWEGNASSVAFTAGAQVRLSKIVVTVDLSGVEAPSISANNVDIVYSATAGNITYTINNVPSPAGTLTASVPGGSWITLGAVGANSVAFTCAANNGNVARTETVTLTYTYNTSETVTKTVTVTQAAAPVVYSTIPAMFAAATSTSTGVLVTFDSWIVSGVSTNGKNVFVTDTEGNGFIIYDNGGGLGSVYHAGDILSGTAVSCNLVLYNGSAEITGLNASDLTITSGGILTASNIAMASLSGVNTGALISYENLLCSVENSKYYLTDGTTTLQVYNPLFAFDALESGKRYNITGVYQQYNSTKEIMPRSASDIEEVVVAIPTITVNTAINVGVGAINGVLSVLYDNFTLDSADVIFYESDGTTPATYSWISASINGENNVAYQVSANTGAARTAYFKVYALDDGANEYYSSLVTVTQAEFVYAPLPFAWDDKNTPTGVTNSGVGTYNSSPYLKFDTTGDYILLTINEAPGTLTYDIMGNSFSGGTFDVETSADGMNYTNLRSYTELGDKQSVSIDNLAETVRYIKWVYTEKSSGNVALGNITLVSASQPSITVSSYSIDATSAETQGTLTVTYKNVETSAGVDISWFEANGTTPASAPSWVDVDVNGSFNVDYLIAENTGAERSAYFKVYGVDAGLNDVYSDLITITQAAVNYTSLPFAFDGGKSDVSNTTGLSQGGLGSDYGSSPKLKFDDTDDYLVLEFNGVPGIFSFNIKGNGFSGGTFKVQTSVNGSDYSDLATYTELGDTQFVEFDNLAADIRFIKWIYTEKVNGNVALGNISLIEHQVPGSTTLTGTPSDGRYWVTYYNETNRYSLPEGAQAFTVNASHDLYRLGEDGKIIPANTAVIIISDSSSIELTQSFSSKPITVHGDNNVLLGSNSQVAVSGITGTPYVLGIVGDTLGFYKFTGDNIPANKAYYVVVE